MTDMLAGYRFGAAWDEVYTPEGAPRPTYGGQHEALTAAGPEVLSSLAAFLGTVFRDQGITFDHEGVERPFPLDIVPRIITADEWDVVERGVAQRVRALEAFLDDVYGSGLVFRDGVVPRQMVVSSQHFHRQAFGIRPPNGVRVHVSGVDLVRDETGEFRVLEDNLRTPSGVSYVVENRRALARVLPELFAGHLVRPVAGYPARLLAALRAAAPPGVEDPTIVVLTPGVYNAAYSEHTLLARQMGVQLVEGRDLSVVGNEVRIRTTRGHQRVDVIYRRVDDEYLDPVQFRADSMVGSPGLLNAARAGNVTLANAVGNGVADDKLIYTYVPDLIRYYLSEEPVLRNVETWRLDTAENIAQVLSNLGDLVLKPVDGSGGKGIVIGPQATDAELATLRGAVEANPRGYVAQRPVRLSTVPTLIGDQLAPRHVDLRPFAVNDGREVWVLPGGLTRVALPEGSLIVNSSQGGGSKDTWVLASPARPEEPAGPAAGGESSAVLAGSDLTEPEADLPAGAGAPGLGDHVDGRRPLAVPPDIGPSEPPREQQQQQQQQQQGRTNPC
ncbi:circularly permuted type 2 ATP-grasp protein [Jiangella alkaliphila]|nr:circularly permuted type 2 ATP-grasp protein [Jiangella alkaliphila]